MSIFGSLLQTAGFLVVLVSLWMIGGVWIFALGAGLACTLFGIGLELASRSD